MAETIELSTWPSCGFNVAWSPENIIAVGLSESVALLVPQLRPSTSTNHWVTIELPTASYPSQQIPWSSLKSWHTFSIGEELSDRHVAALAWSPSAIAKHHTSLLAVLTSNHALSCWECTGRPEVLADWRRAIIINPVLTPIDPAAGANIHESLHRPWRIRAYCWAPSLNSVRNPYDHAPQYMAISKDDGSVVIVKLILPGTTAAADWRLELMHTFSSFGPTSDIPIAQILPQGSTKHRNPYIDQLTWSPWALGHDGSLKSRLVFSSHSNLYCTTIIYHRGHKHELEIFTPVPFLTDIADLIVAGPVQWDPLLGHDDSVALVIVNPEETSMFVFDRAFQLATTVRRPVDMRADLITGLAFDNHDKKHSTIVLSRMLSTCDEQETPCHISTDDLTNVSNLAWRQHLIDAQASWATRMSISGEATTKVYGVDYSPTHSLAAVASSRHPRRLLEYTIDAKKTTLLAIVRTSVLCADDILPDPRKISPLKTMTAESLLIDLLHFSNSSDNQSFSVSDLLQDRLDPPRLDRELHQTSAKQAYAALKDPSLLLARLADRLRSEPVFLRQRHDRLLHLASSDSILELEPDLDTIRMHAVEILALSASLQDHPKDASIINNCRYIVNKIDCADDDPAYSPELVVEECPTCQARIKFESIHWARCANKHQFTRCGLTFLAVPAAHLSKSCSLCDVTYTHTLPGAQDLYPTTGGVNDDLLALPAVCARSSLADILQIACTVCVYCGGRFAG